MKNFRKLQVWEKSHLLTLSVYRHTEQFPAAGKFGLTSQIRRAASSVPANLAEGCGRAKNVEMARFCQIAFGSASELEYHLLPARDLGFLDEQSHTELDAQTTEIKRMLTGLIQKLKAAA
ncbi:MAG TPA: four helix bundle protein [Abditibacteriaceae bacterium]|jgi:four helix bundle protein